MESWRRGGAVLRRDRPRRENEQKGQSRVQGLGCRAPPIRALCSQSTVGEEDSDSCSDELRFFSLTCKRFHIRDSYYYGIVFKDSTSLCVGAACWIMHTGLSALCTQTQVFLGRR